MIDTALLKEFGDQMLAELEKISADSARLVPENFNVLSLALAVDSDKIDDDIAVSGLACINGVDYQKMKSITAHLKTQRQAYLEKMYLIPPFVMGDNAGLQQAIGTADDGVTAILASVNSYTIDLGVPAGWDGRKALIHWFLSEKDMSKVTQESFLHWFIIRQLTGTKKNIGISISPTFDRIRVVVKYERSGDTILQFPGLYLFVKYFRSAT